MGNLWTTLPAGLCTVTALPESKRCPRCGQVLPAAAFSRNGAYLASYCRPCHAADQTERYRASRPSTSAVRQRAAPRVTTEVPTMPEHLHPQALALAYVADGPDSVRSLLAVTGAPQLRAALLADAAARAQVALEATTSPARAARRLLDTGGG